MNDILTIFGIMMALIAIESLILIFVLWKTPAMTFLSAVMFKKPLMYIIGKDHMGRFKTFKDSSGSAKIGKDGIFNITENSHTLEAGSKIPIYFAFRDLAATLLPEYPAIVQEIREKGYKISNVEDIKDLIIKSKQGMQLSPVTVKAYKTYSFHDLENMFPNNLDPTFIDSTVQCEISKGLKMLKLGPQVLGGVIILIMVSAVAVFIVNRAFTGEISIEECSAMIQAARGAVGPAVQAVTTAPIVG
jgi:hypothetical protein